MKSKFKSICNSCNQRIFIGDEIVKGGSGKWIHKSCPPPNEQGYAASDPSESDEELQEPEIKLPQIVKCLNCGNQSFIKKRSHSVTLDNGDILKTKLFICDKCYYKMEFAEN